MDTFLTTGSSQHLSLLLERNKSDSYSEKLELLFDEAAEIIAQFPEAIRETDFLNLRIKVIKHFKIYYFNLEEKVQIIRIWDTRQNPDSFRLS